MKLVADDIETMRIALRAYWTNAGHVADAPEALCDLALKGLRAEQVPTGWIPVSERLPEKQQWCLVCCEGGRMPLGNMSCWFDGEKFHRTQSYSVAWWQPLPSPPPHSDQGEK